MSNGSSDPFFSRPGSSGLPLILALVLANLLNREPLESLRPAADPFPWNPTGQDESVTARLWQDPIAVAYEEVTAEAAGNETGVIPATELKDQVREVVKLTEREDGDVSIVLAMVRGGSWLESRERRLRSRYATVIGFAEQEFFPVDDQHLGVCSMEFSNGERYVVPFEWFQRGGGAGGRALVMWIDEPALGVRPLSRLEELLRQVTTADAGVGVSILGPTSSTTLARMVRDDELLEAERLLPPWLANVMFSSLRGPKVLDGARLLSSWSTVSASVSPEVAWIEEVEAARRRGEGNAWNFGIEFHRYIGTDEKLVELLIEELRLRIPALVETEERTVFENFLSGTFMLRKRGGVARILLLSEADTEYGRSFEREFAKLNSVGTEVLIQELPYLRGVDGKLPGREAEHLPDAEVLPEEAATGRNQLDYLRRMERLLAEQGRDFDAVGILGSDLYDKLAILKAVHDNFPDAVVFTTDLDARLLPTRASPETLNLLVASHFGLTMPRLFAGKEGEAPEDETSPLLEGLSFRSGYQLALCVAAMDAVRRPGFEILATLEGHGWTRHASLYEIGRTDAHELLLPADSASSAATDAPEPEPEAIVAARAVDADDGGWSRNTLARRSSKLAILLVGLLALLPVRRGLKRITDLPGLRQARAWTRGVSFAAVAVIALGAFSVYLWPEVRAAETTLSEELGEQTAGFWKLVAVAAIVVFFLSLFQSVRRTVTDAASAAFRRLGLLGMAALVTGVALAGGYLANFMRAELARPTGEPFALVEGISIWPTELIRAAVALYCILAVIRCNCRLAENQEKVGRELLSLGPLQRSELEARLGWFGIYRRRSRKEGGVTIREMWLDYRAETLTWPTIARVLFFCVVYYFLTGRMFKALGEPGVPSRGWEAYVADRFMLWLSVASMIALIFYVVDEILTTARFLRRLRKAGTSAWPDELREEHGKRWGLAGDEAAEVLGVHMVERVTATVSSLLYFPAIALFLMAFSRTRIFDNWTWSLALVLTFVLGFGILLLAARSVGGTARAMKAESLGRLEEERIRGRRDDARVADTEAAAGVIQKARGGAFARFREHPLVRVLLLPFAGLGAASLLEFFFPLWLKM